VLSADVGFDLVAAGFLVIWDLGFVTSVLFLTPEVLLGSGLRELLVLGYMDKLVGEPQPGD